jgi:hypothetical protein
MFRKQSDEIRAVVPLVFLISFLVFYSIELFLGKPGELSAVMAILWGIAWFLFMSGALNWRHELRDWSVAVAMFLGVFLVSLLPSYLLLANMITHIG